jgi:SAM-dependent methyltransferase
MVALPKIASNLELGADGIWITHSVSAVSYPEEGNDACFSLEDDSFWFRHRNDCILAALKLFPPGGTFFDIGGGNGYVARAVQDNGWEVALIEPGPAGARNALRRGIQHVVCATLDDAGFLPETLPAIGMFDVVEHIADDHTFLSDIKRHLTPGGRLYLTVPAFQWLWSGEDVSAGHYRRYSIRTLSQVLQNAGFEIEFITCFFDFLPLPAFFLRALPYRLGLTRRPATLPATLAKARSEHEVKNGPLKRMLDRLMERELNRIKARRSFSFGGSCLAVARKR